MIELLASAVVMLFGLFLAGLGAVSLVAPAIARRFLLGFASSAELHYLEMGIRLLVGGAVVLCAPGMRFSGVFNCFGWLMVLTTIGLLLIPWRWHQRFARDAVPRALRFLPLMGLASLLMGGFVLFAKFNGDG